MSTSVMLVDHFKAKLYLTTNQSLHEILVAKMEQMIKEFENVKIEIMRSYKLANYSHNQD